MTEKRKTYTKEKMTEKQDLGSKPAKIVLGDHLEYRVARLNLFMGYFVRRSRPIYTVGGLDRATDLDVLAIRYVEPFRREVVITECKSGAFGPLDRIFWLSGVRNYVNAAEAVLVCKGTNRLFSPHPACDGGTG